MGVTSKQMVRTLPLLILLTFHLSLVVSQDNGCHSWCTNSVSHLRLEVTQKLPIGLSKACTSFCDLEALTLRGRRFSRSTKGNIFGRPNIRKSLPCSDFKRRRSEVSRQRSCADEENG